MGRFILGGIYPASRKGNTRRKPLALLDRQPDRVIIPLDMCSTDSAVPVVKVGAKVSIGQCIAKPVKDGVFIHASVSGVVEAIENRPHPWGGTAPAIVIANDKRNTLWDELPSPIDPAHLIPRELLARVRNAGIVGMGGSARPTYEKIGLAMGRVDTLIVNAVECEPYVTADQRLLVDRGDAVLQGALILSQAIRAKRVVVAAEGNQLGAIERLERTLRKKKSSVQLLTLPTRYPLGAEKQLVKSVTGREIPPGGTALDVNCVVFNVATVFAISEALFSGTPLTHRAVTITGGAIVRPRNLWVPIGTPLRCLIESGGGLREELDLALTGGPMMGVSQRDLEAPVVKDTNSLICFTQAEQVSPHAESTCVRCGRCVSACPMHMIPAFVYRAVRLGELHRLDHLHLDDCQECGCCVCICPSQIPLLDLMREAKELSHKGGEKA